MTTNELVPAYILHLRDYSESSYLAKVFTRTHGLLNILIRGAKKPKSRLRGLVRPFNPMLISWIGRSDLLTLKVAEPNGLPHYLQGKTLISGMYLNELLIKLILHEETHDVLYDLYVDTLNSLAKADLAEDLINKQAVVLRRFEKELLFAMGYGIDLEHDAATSEPIEEAKSYIFNPYDGLFKYKAELLGNNLQVSGAAVVALRDNTFNTEQELAEAKQMLRLALQVHLTGPIQSRLLLRKRKIIKLQNSEVNL